MKRVQLILEEWQHEWLGTEAKNCETNMSALLRQLLTEAIEHRQSATLADDPLWGVIGMAEGPDDGVSSENLDDYLYKMPEATKVPARMMAEEKGTYSVNREPSTTGIHTIPTHKADDDPTDNH